MKWYKLEGKKFGKLTVICSGKSVKLKKGTRKHWKCRCECGKETEVVSYSLIKGKTKSCGCLRSSEKIKRYGEKHQNWKGGTHITDKGYKKILCKNHPNAHANGYVLEHVKIMSDHIRRPLLKEETVHHKNGIRDDNRIENLELWSHSHPCGQKIEDKIRWCIEFLKTYDPEKLK